ncbi:GIY-YIG nuclease family protein [Bradyrhizobium glycinis]|uniref:GIY-YIG nuclease family protein n=1 Tax=Bradyrhizobium glycinis TaxID=2751812 RepID=UPI001FE93D4E|nr:GIY-YIG nuclease family protein [Bradyrhizobium glycinis]
MPIYFIGYQSTDGCLIKIGRAKNLRRRRMQLQTASPVTLEVMGWIQSRDDIALERSLHTKFKMCRERGEWFNLDPSEICPT